MVTTHSTSSGYPTSGSEHIPKSESLSHKHTLISKFREWFNFRERGINCCWFCNFQFRYGEEGRLINTKKYGNIPIVVCMDCVESIKQGGRDYIILKYYLGVEYE